MIITILVIAAAVFLVFYMDRPGFSPMTYSVWRVVNYIMAGASIFYGLSYLIFMERPLHMLLAVWLLFCAWAWIRGADKAAEHRELARQQIAWKAMWR